MPRICGRGLIGLVVVSILAAAQAPAGESFIAPGEMQASQSWLKQHLLADRASTPATTRAAPPAGDEAELIVLANHDPVIQNNRGGKPLKLGQNLYQRGLYCHAMSRVVVRLPAAGKRFSATVGVDSNSQTSGGRGSIVFSIIAGDKTLFKTPVMRENTPAREIAVDLDGVRSFILEVGDAGDGIACDQADWADAKVVLADGRELWLGDLPLRTASLVPRTSDLPFCFTYDGRPSDELLRTWPRTEETQAIDAARTRRTLVWTDPKAGLSVRCVAVEYSDFPAVEWTLYLKNAGKAKTPIIENLQALDTHLERSPAGEFILRTTKGDTCRADLYEPVERKLDPRSAHRFAPAGGRASNGAFPYFNLQIPDGGVFLAIGWPGQWSAMFNRDAERGLRIVAGQEMVHLSLEAGEEIRTPLVALLFWRGTELHRSQNLWRRWMWAHNVPRTADGKLPPPLLFGNTSGQFNEMCNASDQNQKYFLDRYREEQVKLDFWWMDAGWYPSKGWPQTGTWEPDLKRFPGGLRSISDHASAQGVGTLVWFEPERVAAGTWLADNHPEWLLDGKLLNLGIPEARQWLTDHVDKLLTREGIHLYRQDFNMDPLSHWRSHDAPGRQGMLENLHIQGYLAYWDELRRRHPALIIDSCASGGRRNDLETMRRAVPLHPTDYNYGHLAAKQAFHQSLFQWIPYFGSNTVPTDTVDPYAFRSGTAMGVVLGYDLRRKDHEYAALRQLAAEWRSIAPLYYGDYYPLTPYSIDESAWSAWQFHRPDRGDGSIQFFRRSKSETAMQVFRLFGLDPEAFYELTDRDIARRVSGRELLDKGISAQLTQKPGAGLITYRKCD